jgi:hypothetical protein
VFAPEKLTGTPLEQARFDYRLPLRPPHMIEILEIGGTGAFHLDSGAPSAKRTLELYSSEDYTSELLSVHLQAPPDPMMQLRGPAFRNEGGQGIEKHVAEGKFVSYKLTITPRDGGAPTVVQGRNFSHAVFFVA